MSTELQQAQPAQTTEVSTITALAADLTAVKQVLAENLGAGGMSEFDLQQIKIPSGGGIAFEVTDLDGEHAETKLKAVVLFHRDTRAYWPQSMEDTGGVPPACHSNDAIIGLGEPGGCCAACPNAQFGSAAKGKGQACKQMKQLFVVREGSDSILPEVFNVPPTSLNAFKKLGLMLGGRGTPITGIVIEIGLAKSKNSDGVTYSEATFKPLRILSLQERAQVKELASLYQPMIAPAIPASAAKPTGGGGLLPGPDAPADPAFD